MKAVLRTNESGGAFDLMACLFCLSERWSPSLFD